jgi:hypothetical protein
MWTWPWRKKFSVRQTSAVILYTSFNECRHWLTWYGDNVLSTRENDNYGKKLIVNKRQQMKGSPCVWVSILSQLHFFPYILALLCTADRSAEQSFSCTVRGGKSQLHNTLAGSGMHVCSFFQDSSFYFKLLSGLLQIYCHPCSQWRCVKGCRRPQPFPSMWASHNLLLRYFLFRGKLKTNEVYLQKLVAAWMTILSAS